MPKRFFALFVGFSLFLFFVFFSYLVHKNFFTQVDFNTTVRLQDNIPRRLDDLFSLLSDIGSFEVMTPILIVVLLLRRKLLGIFFFFSYFAFHLFELYGKFFVEHTPPPEFMLRTRRVLDFPQFHVRAENSYPSGHAGRTIFISIVLFLLIWKSKKLSPNQKTWLLSIIIGFNIVMMISRVYLGEHWTSDVIGAAILAAGLAIGTYAIAK